jgi:hypothetical protein
MQKDSITQEYRADEPVINKSKLNVDDNGPVSEYFYITAS